MSSITEPALQITVNGALQQIAPGAAVADLIAQLQLDIRKVAIERNLAIVPRSAYASTPLVSGDALEIVGFIGGG